MRRDVYAGDTCHVIFPFRCGSVIPEPFFTTSDRLPWPGSKLSQVILQIEPFICKTRSVQKCQAIRGFKDPVKPKPLINSRCWRFQIEPYQCWQDHPPIPACHVQNNTQEAAMFSCNIPSNVDASFPRYHPRGG